MEKAMVEMSLANRVEEPIEIESIQANFFFFNFEKLNKMDACGGGFKQVFTTSIFQ
jgi:hypothetical protein